MKSKILDKVKQSAGFTMIELLIVITILGILAVAVLSAINPIEQINRGRDTGSRSDAEQLISAIDRHYAFNGYYPWQGGASADYAEEAAVEFQPITSVYRRDTDGAPVADSNCTFLEVLAGGDTDGGTDETTCPSTDELKLSFIDRITDESYNDLYIYNRGEQGDSTYICFVPKSAAFETEATERCDGTLPADFPESACNATVEATTAPTSAGLIEQLMPQAYAQTETPIPEENFVCLP